MNRLMLSSVHDPAIFSPTGSGSDENFCALLRRHLNEVADSHIIVIDADNELSKAYITAYGNASPKLQILINAAFVQSARIVRMPIGFIAGKLYKSLGRQSATSASLYKEANVLVAQEKTKNELRKIVPDAQNVHTLSEYDHEHYGLLPSIQTDGINKREFCEIILRPVIKWAKTVRIIDSYVSEPKPEFKNTIQAIYHECHGNTFQRKEIEIVTSCKDPNNISVEAGKLMDYYGLSTSDTKFTLKPKERFKKPHCRFLTTNQGIILSFERGFDFIKGEKCIPCGITRSDGETYRRNSLLIEELCR